MDLKEKEEIVIVDKNETVRSENYGFPFYRRGAIYGVAMGVLMGTASILISLLFEPQSVGWDYLKYIILAFGLWKLLSNYKTYLPAGKIFKDGMLLGLFTSFVAAMAMAGVILVATLAGVDSPYLIHFDRDPETLLNALALSGWAAMDGMTYGLILTFVFLLFLKDSEPAT